MCYLEKKELYSGLIFGTLASLIGKECMKNTLWDTILVDEAGQGSEPNSIGPCSVARRVILVGDHNQLPPGCQHSLMNRSLLERLATETAMPVFFSILSSLPIISSHKFPRF